MRVSVITPCLNSAHFLEAQLKSVAAQRTDALEVEHIVLDAGSTDGTAEILDRNYKIISKLIKEPDNGPADAINKGFTHATGEYVAWLNADDLYAPNALFRACVALASKKTAALCFGHCPIINGDGREIRRGITKFKEFWYPLSSRPTLQILNYISQPATVFRRDAVEAAGPLRTDLKAAWDYEFILRLWRQGGAMRIGKPAMAYFRWTPNSISGRNYERQFEEEYQVAADDAGHYSPQAFLHLLVRYGIVTAYDLMTTSAKPGEGKGKQ